MKKFKIWERLAMIPAVILMMPVALGALYIFMIGGAVYLAITGEMTESENEPA